MGSPGGRTIGAQAAAANRIAANSAASNPLPARRGVKARARLFTVPFRAAGKAEEDVFEVRLAGRQVDDA